MSRSPTSSDHGRVITFVLLLLVPVCETLLPRLRLSDIEHIAGAGLVITAVVFVAFTSCRIEAVLAPV